MPLLRLLATSLLTSACMLPAAAQAPSLIPLARAATATSGNAQTLPAPPTIIRKALLPTFSMTVRPSTFQPSKPVKAELLAERALKQVELAQLHPLCYTLRSYGFTAQDLKSPHPHASSETDCTPASRVHLKALQLPATGK